MSFRARVRPAARVLLMAVSVAGTLAAGYLISSELESPQPGVNGDFGISVAGAGDLNGDGRSELLVGTAEGAGGLSGSGRAYVFDGFTGDTILTLESPLPVAGAGFGRYVAAAGDMNGDTVPDFVVTATQEDGGGVMESGRVYVFSGATGDTLRTLASPNAEVDGRFGAPVSGAGDVNNDDVSDLIVGAFLEDAGGFMDAGRAYVFSGATFDTLRSLESPNPEVQGSFGIAVAGLGDVNGDSHDDIIAGAYFEDVGGEVNAGRAYVFSGATGDTLYSLQSPNPTASGLYGFWVAGTGDVNGDGRGDFVVGARNDDGALVAASGRAYIYDGATGDTIATLDSPNPVNQGRFGLSVAGAGDVNGDGSPDVIVGAPNEGQAGFARMGRAYLFNGNDGSLIDELNSTNPEVDGFFGFSVAGAGRVNDDDSADVLVGAFSENGGGVNNAGRVYVFYGDMGTAVSTDGALLPQGVQLHPNHPNPFNPATTIRFDLAEPVYVKLTVYDVLGRTVRRLADGPRKAGSHAAEWDGRNESGKPVASGVYLYRLAAGAESMTRRMLLIK